MKKGKEQQRTDKKRECVNRIVILYSAISIITLKLIGKEAN